MNEITITYIDSVVFRVPGVTYVAQENDCVIVVTDNCPNQVIEIEVL